MSELNELAAALVKAQAVMHNAEKDRVNPHFKNRYATLGSVLDACKGPLNANGIAVLQMPCGTSEECAAVETMLLHTSGQSISRVNAMPVVKRDPQGHASAITYLRRYGLLAITGLTADDDDDGNEASRRPEPVRQQQQAPQAQAAKPAEFMITEGPEKGTPFSRASAEALNAAGNAVVKVLDDKTKSAHHERAQARLNAIEAEFVSREGRGVL